MNEQQLYANHVRPYLQKLEAAGAPLWWRKTYGTRFSRDNPDIYWSVKLCMSRAIFGAIELKNPESMAEPTASQSRELGRINKGGGIVMIAHSLESVQRMLAHALKNADWTHPTLTEPYL